MRENELLQGTLALLILRTLAPGPLHGHAIAQHIQQRSGDILIIEEGSLYPALYRMDKKGWVKGKWGKSENNRDARFYTLTAAGRKQLKEETAVFRRLMRGMTRVMEGA
ncbi:MAG: PadR family transcriptional regulator [Verrucomicrobia subdivision 3 bacterium]|nr:PadR family transcriptional regulator [Limisphaerales bacterium]